MECQLPALSGQGVGAAMNLVLEEGCRFSTVVGLLGAAALIRLKRCSANDIACARQAVRR